MDTQTSQHPRREYGSPAAARVAIPLIAVLVLVVSAYVVIKVTSPARELSSPLTAQGSSVDTGPTATADDLVPQGIETTTAVENKNEASVVVDDFSDITGETVPAVVERHTERPASSSNSVIRTNSPRVPAPPDRKEPSSTVTPTVPTAKPTTDQPTTNPVETTAPGGPVPTTDKPTTDTPPVETTEPPRPTEDPAPEEELP